jgi:hypothetical protein
MAVGRTRFTGVYCACSVARASSEFGGHANRGLFDSSRISKKGSCTKDGSAIKARVAFKKKRIIADSRIN